MEAMTVFPWNRKEVLVTNSAEQFGIALRALQDAGIRYETRTVNNWNSGQARSLIGHVGERVNLEIFYYIYANKADAERARHFIRQAKY
jgi:hypothetical protein